MCGRLWHHPAFMPFSVMYEMSVWGSVTCVNVCVYSTMSLIMTLSQKASVALMWYEFILQFVISSSTLNNRVQLKQHRSAEANTAIISSVICNWGQEEAHSSRVSYLIVAAGGIEGIGAAGEQCLIITWHQHFDIVVTFVLSGGNSLMLLYIRDKVHIGG